VRGDVETVREHVQALKKSHRRLLPSYRLAARVTLQAADKTLSDKDAAKFLKRLERGVEGLGGELRKE